MKPTDSITMPGAHRRLAIANDPMIESWDRPVQLAVELLVHIQVADHPPQAAHDGVPDVRLEELVWT